MKRLLAGICLVLLLVPALCLPVLAQVLMVDSSIKIHDFTDTLTNGEIKQLEDQANAIIKKLSVDIGVVLVSTTNGLTAEEYADDFYDYNGFGVGTGDDGMLLLVSLGERTFHITTYGKVQRNYSDSALDRLIDRFIDDLSDGDYYRAFYNFLRYSDSHLSGQLLSYSERVSVGTRLLLALLAGGGIGAVVILVQVLRHKKSLSPAPDTAHYMPQNGFVVTHRRDRFVHTYTHRTAIPKNNSSGGSGGAGSTHRSSSGRSHGGRGGRF